MIINTKYAKFTKIDRNIASSSSSILTFDGNYHHHQSKYTRIIKVDGTTIIIIITNKLMELDGTTSIIIITKSTSVSNGKRILTLNLTYFLL
jgi:hypothetical protein